MSFSEFDAFLYAFISSSYSPKEKVSENALAFSATLHCFSNELQNAMQLGSLTLADPRRVELVVDLDNALEPMSAKNRVQFVEHIVQEPELLLTENRIATDSFTVLSFKSYWVSELFLMRASLNPYLTQPDDYLFHRARSWAASMLFMLKPSVHSTINKGLMESTALRGLCLAIMDDADDAEKDSENQEHTIFTVYPEHAKLMCENILVKIEQYQENTGIFSDIEMLLGKYRILPCLAGAALISLKEFQHKEKSKPVFHVRNFLQYIIDRG
jgi:hypothetical protein